MLTLKRSRLNVQCGTDLNDGSGSKIGNQQRPLPTRLEISLEGHRGIQPSLAALRQNRGNKPKMQTRTTADGEKEDLENYPRAIFYEHYRKEAGKCQRESMKDLDTTLVLAGLLSGITYAFGTFIVQPTPTLDHVQAVLFVGLNISLFSAFLAIISRHCMVTACQDQLRKLDGTLIWYFDRMVESLTLMLQAAVFLFGYALFCYLWRINTTVPSLVFTVVIFDVFTIVAGEASLSYPGAHILRHVVHSPALLHSALCVSIESSACYRTLFMIWDELRRGCLWDLPSIPPPFDLRQTHAISTLSCILLLPFGLIHDGTRLLLPTIEPFVIFFRRMHFWLRQESDQRAATLDMVCISRTLRTSRDKSARVSALNYLATITPIHLDHTLAVECFDTLIRCVEVTNDKVTIVKGLEQLAELSSLCCLHLLSYLTIEPHHMPRIEEIRHRYARAFPPEANFEGLPCSHTLGMIHSVFYEPRRSYVVIPTSMQKISLIMWRADQAQRVQWRDYKPSSNEHVIVACALAKLAQFEYQRRGHRKVSRWLLRFVLHSLSMSPPPPTSVVVDCLSIIAIDLGCKLPKSRTLDEKVELEKVSRLLIEKLRTMVKAGDRSTLNQCKPIGALLPYAAQEERHGKGVMLDAFLRSTKASKGFVWDRILPTLCEGETPLTVVIVTPHVNWFTSESTDCENLVFRWAAAVSVVSYSEEVAQSVVDALLQIASIHSLRPLIPVDVWAWLKTLPSLPVDCFGRSLGFEAEILNHVRALGDIEILKSYLLLVWSEWNLNGWFLGFELKLVLECFHGIGMKGHREDLMKRLDYVIGQLDWGSRSDRPKYSAWMYDERAIFAKQKYMELRVLLE